MNAQNLLTLLVEVIAISFIIVTTIDFISHVKNCHSHNKSAVLVNQSSPCNIPITQPMTQPELPEEQAIPLEEVEQRLCTFTIPDIDTRSLLRPLSGKDANCSTNIDIASLKVRSARKVAKALGIKQKTNGCSKSLNSLRQEILERLDLSPEEVINALQQVVVS